MALLKSLSEEELVKKKRAHRDQGTSRPSDRRFETLNGLKNQISKTNRLFGESTLTVSEPVVQAV